MAKVCDLKCFNDIFYRFCGFFFRNAQIERPEGNFLIDAGAEKLGVGILKDDSHFAAKFQQIFFAVRYRLSLEKEFSLIRF